MRAASLRTILCCQIVMQSMRSWAIGSEILVPLPLLRSSHAKSAEHSELPETDGNEPPHSIRLYLAQRDIAGAHVALHHYCDTSQAVPSTCMEMWIAPLCTACNSKLPPGW